jgi:nucleoside-diphosphate-sugar epimerase
MKVFLIIGASGMVGSRLVRELARKKNVKIIALDKNPPRQNFDNVIYLQTDLMDESITDKIGRVTNHVNYVVHLAAVTDLDGCSFQYYQFNYLSLFQIKEISDYFAVERVVFSSTQLVNNIWADGGDAPVTLYGESKRIAESLIGFLLPDTAIIVRLTTVWGEGHNPHYDRFISYLRRGLYFHSGRQPVFKSYSYIGNCVHQIINICYDNKYSLNNKVFYICDPEPIEIRKYVDDICAQVGARMPAVFPRSLSKLLAMLGDALNKIGINFPFNSYRFNNIVCSYIYESQELQEMVGDLPYTYESAMEEYGLWLRTKK